MFCICSTKFFNEVIGVQQAIESVISVINDFFWSNLLIILLVSIGIYFTIRSRFLQFRMLKEMVLVLKEGRAAKDGESPRFKLSA